MNSTTVQCPLCLFPSSEFKELVNESGQHNDIYKISVKYFDPLLLISKICANCWRHIQDFHEFQQSVLDAQTSLIVEESDVPFVKVETLNIQSVLDAQASLTVEELDVPFVRVETLIINEDYAKDINTTSATIDDLIDYNPFDSEDEMPLAEHLTKNTFELKQQVVRVTVKKIGNTTSSDENTEEEDKDVVKPFEYKCKVCDESLKYGKTLGKHITHTHTGKFTYQCRFCPMSFCTNKNILRHIKSNHPNKLNPFAGSKNKNSGEKKPTFMPKDYDDRSKNKKSSEKKPTFMPKDYDDIIKNKNSSEKKPTFMPKDYDDIIKNKNSSEKKPTFMPKDYDERKFKCNLCGNRYNHGCKLNEHIKFHHNKEENSCQCSYCPSKYTLKRNLDRHIKRIHPEYVDEDVPKEKFDLNSLGRDLKDEDDLREEPPNYDDYDAFIAKWKPQLECYSCNSTYSSFPLLAEHFYVEHPGEICYVECCEYKLRTRSNLTDHIRFHLDPNSFKCTICERNLTSKIMLRAHIRTHTEEKLKCPHCEKSFYDKTKLDVHIGTHSTEINVFCKVCNKGFATELLLKKHEYTHKTSVYLCDQCATPFKHPGELKAHLLEHAGGGIESPQSRLQRKRLKRSYQHRTIYVCSECGTDSMDKTKLLQQKQTVDEGSNAFVRTILKCPTCNGSVRKFFKCNTCDRKLTSAVSLRLHEATHSSESEFQCPHCPVLLKHEKNIGRHIKIVHPNEYAKGPPHKRTKKDIGLEKS